MGMQTKPNRTNSWLPPSPFSTEPNSPAIAGDEIPGINIHGDFTDGGSDDIEGGYSNHWSKPLSLQARRDHWVQSLGRCCLDRSIIDSDDVTQSHVDNNSLERHPFIGVGVAQEPINGQVSQNGIVLNATTDRKRRDSMGEEGTTR